MQNAFQNYKLEKRKGSERKELTSQIFDIYSSETQKMFRRKENWKRYCGWAKENKFADSKDNQAKFKKTKLFIKEHNIKTIVYFLSHIPTADLYYILSMAKDMQNRNQNFSGYLINGLRSYTIK